MPKVNLFNWQIIFLKIKFAGLIYQSYLKVRKEKANCLDIETESLAPALCEKKKKNVSLFLALLLRCYKRWQSFKRCNVFIFVHFFVLSFKTIFSSS